MGFCSAVEGADAREMGKTGDKSKRQKHNRVRICV